MPYDFNLADQFAAQPDTIGPQPMPASDIQMGPQVQPTNLMNQPTANNGGLPAALSAVSAWGYESQKRATEQKAIAQLDMNVNPITGMAEIKNLPLNLMNEMLAKVKQSDQINTLYAKMSAEKQAQIDYVKAHPWANTLATIAGSLAANDTNPITRGLGQAAQQLNPTQQQLQAQQMQLLGQQSAGLNQQIGTYSHLASLQQATTKHAEDMAMDRQRMALDERRVKLAEGSTAERADTKRIEDEQRFNKDWTDRAAKRLFDPKAFVAEYKKVFPKATDADIQEQLQGKMSMQKAATALAKEVGNEKANEFANKQKANYDYFLQKNAVTHAQDMEKIKARVKDANPKLTAAQLKSVTDGEEAAMLISNLKSGLDTHPDMFGPMWLSPTAAYKRTVDPLFDEAASKLTADYAHATPIMIKLLGEGARGYSQGQRQWVEEKVPRLTDTAERVKGKIAFMEGLLEAKKRGDDLAYVKQAMVGGKTSSPMTTTPIPTAASHATSPAAPMVIDGFTITVK